MRLRAATLGLAMALGSSLGGISLYGEQLMIDTFDIAPSSPALTAPNALGGVTGAWQGDPTNPAVRSDVSSDSETPRGRGRSLRVDYQIQSPREHTYIPSDFSKYRPVEIHGEGFCGYYSLLPEVDARRFRYLTFWVKGDPVQGFTHTFKVELKDPTTTASHLVEGVTDRWQRIVIPFTALGALKDWSQLREFTIVFDHASVTRPSGSLLIDELAFSTSAEEESGTPPAPPPARLEGPSPPAVTPPTEPFVLNVPARRQPPRPESPFPQWEGPPQIVLRPPESLEWGTITSSAVLAAEVWSQWDFDALYLRVRVTDGEVKNRYRDRDLWRGDCVEVYLSLNPVLEWENPRDLQLGIAPTGPEGRPQLWAWFQGHRPPKTEVLADCQVAPGRYTCEVALRWAWFRLRSVPQENQRLGFSVAVHEESPPAKLNWRFQKMGKRVTLGQLRLVP